MNNKLYLYNADRKRKFSIISTPKISLLENLGIREGTTVSVQSRHPWGGPVLLRVEDAYSLAVDKDVAKQIEVREVAS
ncbi:MAG: ferrous iron transport protein A [Oscillospiraceae bacterium]|nr:ferrous iron transport protein A [Oscillospiraceae bacterium]